MSQRIPNHASWAGLNAYILLRDASGGSNVGMDAVLRIFVAVEDYPDPFEVQASGFLQ